MVVDNSAVFSVLPRVAGDGVDDIDACSSLGGFGNCIKVEVKGTVCFDGNSDQIKTFMQYLMPALL
jgi:hypothetical protein